MLRVVEVLSGTCLIGEAVRLRLTPDWMMLLMRLTIPLTFVGALLAAPVLSAQARPAQAQPAQSQPDYANAMRHEHAKDTPAPSPAARIAPRAEVESQTVVYGTVDGRQIKGFLTKPKGAKGGPAIIMVHEWWGLNDNIQAVAKRYAGEGYTVLAVDLFGRVATTPDSAMVLYQTAMKNVPAGEKNIAAATSKEQTKIGELLVCSGCLSRVDLQAALAKQVADDGIKLGRILLQMNAVTEKALFNALRLQSLIKYKCLTVTLAVKVLGEGKQNDEALESTLGRMNLYMPPAMQWFWV